jgi:cobalt-zinc-cadmium efflux system outer membrane protein
MSGRWLLLTLTTVLACGCFHSLGTGPDLGLCLLPERRPAQASPPEGGKSAGAESCRPEPPAPPGASIPDSTPPPNRLASRATAEKGNIVRVQAEQPLDRDQLVRKLEVPPELPGSAARVQTLPPLDQKQQRDEAISRAFPPLPASGADTPPLPGPDGHPLTLADLQKLGLAHSPQIRQAVADLEAARGAAIQAGLHPNPNFGYEGDTMGTAALPGYQGGYLEQTVKTAGKLTYARAAALADVRNAELALRAARIDLATRVRTGYFGVVVARESVKVNRALVRFADEIYSVRLEHLRAGQIAPYELSQFRVYAMQARNDLIQALNRSTAAWKQLAAAVGLPGMPPTALAGSVDMPLPRFDYAAVLARIMAQHTDVLTAENTIQRAKFNLLLAKVTPIPDIDLRILLQKDYTSNTFLLTPSVAVGGRVPIFDQNQGNIQQAGAQLARAQEDVQRARNDLTARLAEAFERYETNREIMESTAARRCATTPSRRS